MKVVYRSLIGEITKAIENAALANRTIAHVELSPAEMHELRLEITSTDALSYYSRQRWAEDLMVGGVQVKEAKK